MKRLLSTILLVLLLSSGVLAQGNGTPPPTYETYIVAQGDTVGRIAAHFGTTTTAIMQANQLANPNLIYVGELLLIPIPSTSGANPTAAASTPTSAPAVQASPTLLTSPTAVEPIATFAPGTPLVVAPPPEQTGATQPAEAQQLAQPPAATPEVETTQPVEVTQQAALTQAVPITQQPASLNFEWGAEVSGFTHLSEMTSTGMSWAKVPFIWKEGDSADSLKSAIDQIHASSLKVLLQISGDPAEMAGDFAHYDQDYVDFLSSVAALAPDAIEVWGGENISDHWAAGRIDPAAYTQLLTSAYRAIKQANSHILVITGALAQTIAFNGTCSTAGCDDVPYLIAMASAGAGQAADCIGVDYTLGATSPDQTANDPRGNQFLYYYQRVVSTYASIFPGKPLCFTGLGYLVPSAGSTDTLWASKTTPQNRANWIARAAQLATQSGRILMMIVYNLDETDGQAANYAILGADNSCTACDLLNTTLRG